MGCDLIVISLVFYLISPSILEGLCAGTLVSPRVILSAHHCTVPVDSNDDIPCDHSDGKRLAAIGRHVFHYRLHRRYETVPVIQVFSPPHGGLKSYDDRTHDFALLLLQYPARYTSKVSPICLPQPNTEYGGMTATAAGWGRYAKPSVSTAQSPVLKMVQLKVSNKKYNHRKMFGTIVSKKDHVYQDPCSGDSGAFVSSLMNNKNKLGLSYAKLRTSLIFSCLD